LAYSSSIDLSIVALARLLKVIWGLTKKTSYSFSSIFVGSIREVTILTKTVHVVATVGEIGPSWGSLGHFSN
jgi:hypothetical protein